MRAFIVLLCALASSPLESLAQVSVGIGASYCTFNMDDLKALNEEFATINDVPAEITQQFPPYIGFDIDALYRFQRHRAGMFYSFNSTGSRVTYEDYSGKVQYDQILKSHHFGVTYGYNIIARDGPWAVVPSVRLGSIKTALQISTYQRLGSDEASEAYDFVSTSTLVSPGIAVTRELLPWLEISIDTRYLANISSNLTLKDNKDIYLTNNQQTPLGAQWSGLRVTGALVLKIPGKRGADRD